MIVDCVRVIAGNIPMILLVLSLLSCFALVSGYHVGFLASQLVVSLLVLSPLCHYTHYAIGYRLVLSRLRFVAPVDHPSIIFISLIYL